MVESSALSRNTPHRTYTYTRLFYSFACRSQRFTLPELKLFNSPYLFGGIAISALLQSFAVLLPHARPVFGTSVLSAREWALVLALALAPVTLVEVFKLARAAIRGGLGLRGRHPGP